MNANTSFIANFTAARRAGVPLLVVESADPAASIASLASGLNGKADSTPIFEWDIVRALRGVNQLAADSMGDISAEPSIETGNPAECLRLLAKVPDNSLVFFHNAQRFLTSDPTTAPVMQGVWNLRDDFKSRGCSLVLLAPSLTLPAELKQAVLVLNEPLPTADEIDEIVAGVCNDAGIEDTDRKATVETLLGLDAFAAEQTFAMSVSKSGIDRGALWERKCRTIEQTPGLSVWRGGETFADIGGCENAKGFVKDILRGRRAPQSIVFMDEIEKVMAGSGSDTSGVSQDYLRCLLTYMQDREAAGLIFIGPPGAAKSAVAKAAGNEVNIPTIAFDLGGMKGSLVGESEQRLRSALQVVDAVSQGQSLFIATCNSIGSLPPELRRRFTLGTFFFDLPSAAEREAIWKIYLAKYALADEKRPDSSGWTGAEIKQCCQIAWRLNKSLAYAATFIVPVSKAAADTIEGLRKGASGRFLSAGKPGLYTYTPPAATGRKIAANN